MTMLSTVVDRARRAVGLRKRPLLKTGSYRAVSLGVTIIAAYLVSGDPSVALDIGVLASAAKLVVYYGHERAWDAVESDAGSE